MSIIFCHICGNPGNDEFESLDHYETIHNLQFNNTKSLPDILKAKRKTKNGAIAAIISGAITTILALTGFAGFDKWFLFDAAFTFGLANYKGYSLQYMKLPTKTAT